MDQTLRQRLERMRDALQSGRPSLSPQELLAIVESLDQALAQLDSQSRSLRRLLRHQRGLDDRVRAIEHSRLFRALKAGGRLLGGWNRRLGRAAPQPVDASLYRQWVQLEIVGTPPPDWFAERASRFRERPLFSILLPAGEPAPEWLEGAVNSVLGQHYPEWELWVWQSAPGETWVADCLARVSGQDRRIRLAASQNPAVEAARGDYVLLLDSSDALAPHALHYVAEVLNQTQPDLIYSDEDRLDSQGRRCDPVFKPAWSPELLASGIYPGRLLVVSRQALEAAGGYRGSCGEADHDLVLRLAERHPRVRHIPRVLCHRRKPPQPLPPRASRREVAGQPLVSLIICSRNSRLLARCVKRLAKKTSYAAREVIVVQHTTGRAWPLPPGCRGVPYEGPFNFADMSNRGAQAARGEILLFVNDDVEPLAREWLACLVAQVQRPEVGVAGARLLYPSGAIQHAGIAVGIMEGSGHPGRGTAGSRCWPWLEMRRRVSAVTGACLAVRRAVFDQLGGFDASFAVNYNDVDFCLRARQAGLEVIYEPAAALMHWECRSRPPGSRHRERERFLERWAEIVETGDPYYNPNLTSAWEDASLELEEALEPASFLEGR